MAKKVILKKKTTHRHTWAHSYEECGACGAVEKYCKNCGESKWED